MSNLAKYKDNTGSFKSLFH